MTRNNITLLLVFGIILALLFGYAQYCNPVTTAHQPVNVDSIEQVYQQERDSIAVNQFALEREIAVLEELRRLDQEALNRANTTLTESNQKVRSLIAANRELKAANDTIGLMSNCNDLVVDAYNLTVAVDSLQTALAESQTLAIDLIAMQDAAIEAANDAALKADQFAKKVMEELAVCQVAKVKESKKEKKKRFWQRVGDFLKGAFVGGAAKSIADAVK